jgi:hypothetical protein
MRSHAGRHERPRQPSYPRWSHCILKGARPSSPTQNAQSGLSRRRSVGHKRPQIAAALPKPSTGFTTSNSSTERFRQSGSGSAHCGRSHARAASVKIRSRNARASDDGRAAGTRSDTRAVSFGIAESTARVFGRPPISRPGHAGPRSVRHRPRPARARPTRRRPPSGSHVQNVAIRRGSAQILTFPTLEVGFVSCARARGPITTFPTPGTPEALGAGLSQHLLFGPNCARRTRHARAGLNPPGAAAPGTASPTTQDSCCPAGRDRRHRSLSRVCSTRS